MDNQPTTTDSDNHITNSPNTAPPLETPSTASSEETRASTALAAEKKKRRSRPLLVVLLALLIATLGGIATMAVYTLYFDTPAEKQELQSSGLKLEQKLTATSVVSVLQQNMTGTTVPEQAPNPPAIKIAGKTFYTQIQAANSLVASRSETVPSAQADVERANLVKLLKDRGFEENTLTPPGTETTYLGELTHKDVACTLQQTQTLNNSAADHLIGVACANMADYAQLAATQQPFMTAFGTDGSVSIQRVIAIGEPNVVTSATQGFQTAELPLMGYNDGSQPASNGFMALFYQTPDKVWHFFKTAQGIVPCSEYNSAELKKAYVSNRCTGPNNQELKVSL